MADNQHLLIRAHLKQLRLPAMGAEFAKLAREAADANEDYEQYLLRLTELEVAARASNAVQARIRAAGFPVAKDFDTFDFTAVPSLSKPKVLELARGEWIEQRTNTCFIGSPGTGKTHLAIALGLAACRQGKRVRFATAATLVTRLAVPGVRRPLRASQPVGDQQPSLQRVDPDLPGRAHDGGAVGSADAPLPNLRDEQRKLPLPRVDEEEGQKERGMKHYAAVCLKVDFLRHGSGVR
jgi:hypothetical protein